MARPFEHSPLKLVRTTDSTPERARPDHRQAAPLSAVERALALMRADLRQRWTVSTLARRVGLSRAVFARKFRESVGTSPMKHLARERMREAARLLTETRTSLAQIGVAVGYDSEFAFNKAFKRWHHVAPGAYRRGQHLMAPMMCAA